MAGLNNVSGEYVVIMDDDFQNPPKEALKLLIYSVLLIFWLSPFSVFIFGLDEILIWLIFLFLTILIVNHLFFSFCSKLIK